MTAVVEEQRSALTERRYKPHRRRTSASRLANTSRMNLKRILPSGNSQPGNAATRACPR